MTLKLTLDTGVIANDKPVFTSVSLSVLTTATDQNLYDAAYALAEYSEYEVYSIVKRVDSNYDPID